MPVPQHIFDPPFNIIRSSHVVLDVVDLNASREFYENNVGLHVEDRDDEAVYLRGSEEHQHHSLVLMLDRKSTRLNSSHMSISYAVFCLKKKNNNKLNLLNQII